MKKTVKTNTVKTKVMAAVLAAVTACAAGTVAIGITASAMDKHPGESGYNYVNENGKHPGEAGYNYHEENEEDVNANGKHPGEAGYNYVNEYGKHPGESGYGYKEMSATETKKSTKTFALEFYGYDWNYSADSTNAKITCEFDYANKNAKFIATGMKAGITNAVLKVKNEQNKWYNIPVTFTVDDDLNVSVNQTGDVFTTEK